MVGYFLHEKNCLGFDESAFGDDNNSELVNFSKIVKK